MKKLLMISIITTAMIACSKEDVNLESNQNVVPPTTTSIAGVGLNEDGFLSFDSENAFKDFISSHTESSNASATRSGSSGFLIDGFQSIANLQERVSAVTRSSDVDVDEMSEEEFNLMKAEELLLDPVLNVVVDTTLRLCIEERFYKITPHGTFSSTMDNQENVIAAIAQFDTTLIQNLTKGEYFDLGNGITFINSFGEESVDSSEIELISSDEPETRAVASNSFHSGYSVNSYTWKNNSIWQKFWDRIRGKNVERENYFDSNRRVKVRVFDVNYGFYASSGISIKMQRRKKFWFVRYWVSDHADKMAVGFNKLYGELKLNNPQNFSTITPSASSKWGSFKGTLNGITSDFVYGNYHKLSVVRGWVDDIYMFMPKVTIFNNQLEKTESLTP